MRLRQEQARILREILEADTARSIHLRADARDRSSVEEGQTDPVVTAYNQRLAALRAMTEELARLAVEMSWPHEASVDLRMLVGDIDVTDYVRFIITEA